MTQIADFLRRVGRFVFGAVSIFVFILILMLLLFYAAAFVGDLTGWFRIENYITHSDH
jgi:hypothetical protein